MRVFDHRHAHREDMSPPASPEIYLIFYLTSVLQESKRLLFLTRISMSRRLLDMKNLGAANVVKKKKKWSSKIIIFTQWAFFFLLTNTETRKKETYCSERPIYTI